MTVPNTIQMIFEAKNLSVQVEQTNNEVFKGTLKQVDYNLNIELENATDIKTQQKYKSMLIRGSQIKFIKVPDLLAKLPCFTQKTE